MRKSIKLKAVGFFLLVLLIPAIPLAVKGDKPAKKTGTDIKSRNAVAQAAVKTGGTAEEADEKSEKQAIYGPDTGIKVYYAKKDEVITIPAAEYLRGVVAAEMPVEFHEEALKAQALAANTFLFRQIEKNMADPDESLKGGCISTDPGKHQAYRSKEELKKIWGSRFDECYKRISDAVDAVIGKVILYGDEPIVAAFHSMSGGKTESAKNVWGGDVSYLQPVDSPGDTEVESFQTTLEISAEDLKKKLEASFDGVTLPEDRAAWIVVTARSLSGTVTEAAVGDKAVDGGKLRSCLSLRSANFDVTPGDTFVFTVRGYGHGVGMSQYGANALAKEGYTWDEIIAHYYTGVTIGDLTSIDG